MSKTLILSTIYNNLELVEQSVSAVLQHASTDYQYGLIYNHPPDARVWEYITAIAEEFPDRVSLIDPDENLGCHHGFDYGLQKMYPAHRPAYVVKLDDDTVMETPDWDAHMVTVLENNKKIGLLSSNIDAKQGKDFRTFAMDDYILEIPMEGVIGFSCVMFRAKLLRKIGGLGSQLQDHTLYGGEEGLALQKIRELRKEGAYLQNVHAHHLGNEHRNPDYVLWKVCYGYLNATAMDLATLQQHPEEQVAAYTQLIDHFGPEHAWSQLAQERLTEIAHG